MMKEKQKSPQNSVYSDLEESEPYLGPAWAFVMIMLYLLMQAFPVPRFGIVWWLEIYVIFLVFCVTIFTLIKRRNYYRALKNKEQEKKTDSEPS
jgi:dolichyl-phosphate-mannose--protein O-mannosyl transferase